MRKKVIFIKPVFVEATEETIYSELEKIGIKGRKLLPPPIVGINKDGIMFEMFMHSTNGKNGWMVHATGRKIMPEFIDKYFQ